MKKLKLIVVFITIIAAVLYCTACDKVFGKDETTSVASYVRINGTQLYFTLEFRDTGTGQETADGDYFPHATTDGELISSWKIPYYGATVYESIVKFFDGRTDNISFKLSQHRYYMFHECVLSNGDKYNLETVYIAADGKYSLCANFQKLAGEDGVFGTTDDLKVLTLVYKGWLY